MCAIKNKRSILTISAKQLRMEKHKKTLNKRRDRTERTTPRLGGDRSIGAAKKKGTCTTRHAWSARGRKSTFYSTKSQQIRVACLFFRFKSSILSFLKSPSLVINVNLFLFLKILTEFKLRSNPVQNTALHQVNITTTTPCFMKLYHSKTELCGTNKNKVVKTSKKK